MKNSIGDKIPLVEPRCVGKVSRGLVDVDRFAERKQLALVKEGDGGGLSRCIGAP